MKRSPCVSYFSDGCFIKNFPILTLILCVATLCCISTLPGSAQASVHGEIYSESNHVPDYGLLTESVLRLHLYKNDTFTSYLGAAIQSQNKTQSSQTDLYDKNRVMALAGVKIPIWSTLTAILEARTEDRSRVGLFLGNIWIYPAAQLNAFSEFYAESMIMTAFHSRPVSTGWFKQGFRFQAQENFLVDPFAEFYIRRSPTPDLGRDTEQARLGLRMIYLFGSWNASLLAYESFPRDEASHTEALFVIGGSF